MADYKINIEAVLNTAKAEQELQDIIKMVKVGYQENNKLINNLNKLINEALEK